jgi:hypothetical protein
MACVGVLILGADLQIKEMQVRAFGYVTLQFRLRFHVLNLSECWPARCYMLCWLTVLW